MALQTKSVLDTPAPFWFRTAVTKTTVAFDCDSKGARIRYRGWNPHEVLKPGLLFVHGFRAHSHWWDFIAPWLTDRFRVYALDLSGMGDSGFRDHYSAEVLTHDIEAVLDDACIPAAMLIGHSFGGGRVLRACVEFPEKVGRAIVLDTAIRDPEEPFPLPAAVARIRVYPDRESILARFRLDPEQPALPYLREYLARHSIRAVEGGWTWRFDPRLSPDASEPDGISLLRRVRLPFYYVCGEHSAVVSAKKMERIGAALPDGFGHGPFVLRGGHHHLMLDNPLLLLRTLRKILQ